MKLLLTYLFETVAMHFWLKKDTRLQNLLPRCALSTKKVSKWKTHGYHDGSSTKKTLNIFLLGHIQFEDSSFFLYFQLEIPSSRLQSVTIKICFALLLLPLQKLDEYDTIQMVGRKEKCISGFNYGVINFWYQFVEFREGATLYLDSLDEKKSPLQKIAGLTQK